MIMTRRERSTFYTLRLRGLVAATLTVTRLANSFDALGGWTSVGTAPDRVDRLGLFTCDILVGRCSFGQVYRHCGREIGLAIGFYGSFLDAGNGGTRRYGYCEIW
jgi:hypothetical protein